MWYQAVAHAAIGLHARRRSEIGLQARAFGLLRPCSHLPAYAYLLISCILFFVDSYSSTQVKYLRSNDYRIVRFQLSNEARGKQIQFAKTESGIHLVLKMLKNQKTESRKLAAELIHLLATENYPLSQRIGLNAWLPDSAGIRVSSTFRSKSKAEILCILSGSQGNG